MKAFRLPGGRKPRSFGEKFDPEGEFFGSRERIPVRDRRPWKRALLCMLGGAVLTGGILLGSGLWRVKEVSAADGQFYTAAVIKEYAAISEGDGMLGFDSSDVAARLRKGLPLLTDIRIRKGLGGKVTITFREITRVYYTCHNENYYLINAERITTAEEEEPFGQVLGVFSNAKEARRVGAVYVGLPEATRVRVGDPLTFINLPYEPDSAPEDRVDYELETDEPAVEYAYVLRFIQALMTSPLAPRVTGMDLSDRYDIFFVLDRRILVRVGSMDELDRKLDLAARSLEDREAAGKDDGTLPVLVDVTDPARIIHRASPDVPLPEWAVEEVG